MSSPAGPDAAAGRLAARLAADSGPILMPGVYDGVSAHLVQAAGFEAAFMTGAGVAASVLGVPDIGLATHTEMARQASMIAGCLDIPLLADADGGYGNATNTFRTVAEYARAGVAAIQLEDQEVPKRGGHLSGKGVISAAEFCDKLAAAVEARSGSGMLIVARTDAIAEHGLDEAIRRAQLYADAGADLIFVEAPTTREHALAIPGLVDRPAVFNVGLAGVGPALSLDELEDAGYQVLLFPSARLLPYVVHAQEALHGLRQTGVPPKPVMSVVDIFNVVGLGDWLSREARFSSAGRG